jgi:glycosyltransferase involved in cell wall biosynthesis
MSRIVIDYTPALRQTAGIGRYTRGLVRASAQLDRHNQYTLFCAGNRPPVEPWPPNFRLRASRLPARWLTAGWHRLHVPLPAELLTGRAELFHSPDFALPPLARARGVVTVHDLSFLRLPECADPGLRGYLQATVPRSVERAHRILADSESTRRDLVELLGIREDKVSVVHGGVEPRFHHLSGRAELDAVRARYALPAHFILGLGTLEPRKNFKVLIAAFAELLRQDPSLPQHLVIAGKPGWLYEDIFREVDRQNLAGSVHFPGFIADADLPALYNLADLFAFPSLYEGFGLPPLEALACGTPVVCADNSSLPETVGDAALLVDAEDVLALAYAFGQILNDGRLRDRLRVCGDAQVARFSWDAAARELLAAYDIALS